MKLRARCATAALDFVARALLLASVLLALFGAPARAQTVSGTVASGAGSVICTAAGAFPIYNATLGKWACSTDGGAGSQAVLSGNFGIGGVSPGAGLYLNSGNANALTSGAGFEQIGGTSGNNLLLDYNSVQARNNGAANTLTLNGLGGLMVFGSGAGVDTGAQNTTLARFLDGTTGSRHTTATSSVVISRWEAIHSDAFAGGYGALYVTIDATNTCTVCASANPNTNAINAQAIQRGIGDTVAVVGIGTQSGSGGYSGYGGFFDGVATTPNNSSWGTQVVVENRTGTDFSWASGTSFSLPASAGLDISSGGTKRATVGVGIRAGSAQFDVGLGFFQTSVLTASIQDDSSSVNVLKVTGAHTNGIEASSASFSTYFLRGPNGFFVDGNANIAGQSLTTTGTTAWTAKGTSTGQANFTVQAAQGTPTLTIPTATGTLVASANSPLNVNATTGAASINTATNTALGAASGDNATLTVTAGAFAINLSHVNLWPGLQTFSGSPTGSLANGNAQVAASTANGGLFGGQGSSTDTCLINKNAANVLCIPTNTLNVTIGNGSLTVGTAGTFTGTALFAGATSGSVTVTPQATAGSPTLTLPNTTGTFAVGASSPLVLSAITGNLTCPTCATTTNGGALSATAPVTISAGGVIALSIDATLQVVSSNLSVKNTTLNAGTNVGLTAPGAMTSGSTYTIGATTDTVRFAALALGGAAPATGFYVYNAFVNPTANGMASTGASSTNGGTYGGQGSANDVSLVNKSGTSVCAVPTGTTNLSCNQVIAAGNSFVPTSSGVENSALRFSGAFGGGIVLVDTTARLAIWGQNTGTTLRIGFGTATGVTEAFQFVNNGGLMVADGTAIPAGGTASVGLMFSSTVNFGTFFGSGAPTLSAAKGSLYLRSDGSATNNRAYINTDGSTTWTPLTTGSWLLKRDLDPAANDNSPAFVAQAA